jgi:hypothetical protein
MKQEKNKGVVQRNESEAGQLKRERYQEMVRETIGDLYGNARYWDFFKCFQEESVHDFIIEYATKKAWYQVNGDRILSNRINEETRFRDIAYKCLWEIQQKKLYNLQCEWRAGLVEVEGISTTRDFLYWEKAISHCPFIEPVSLQEYELYCEYVRSGCYQEKNWYVNWQDYDMFRERTDGSELMPAWYRYFDGARGTSYLMLLPDRKGKEERQYLEAWALTHDPSEEPNHEEEKGTGSALPSLYLNYETLGFFIRTFENKTLMEYFEAAESRPEDAIRDQDLDAALRILKHAPVNTTLPPANNWRDSVIQGAREFMLQSILANLSLAFDDYRFRLGAGISHDNCGDDELSHEYFENAMRYRSRIEIGKKICENL